MYNSQKLRFGVFFVNFEECLKSSSNLVQVFVVVVVIAAFVVFLSTLCLCLLTVMFIYDFFQISGINILVSPAYHG